MIGEKFIHEDIFYDVSNTQDGNLLCKWEIGYNQKQLLDMGVKANNIYTSSIDTFTSPEYFSHYRAMRRKENE